MTTITLYDFNENSIEVQIEYTLEKGRFFHEITRVKILTVIPPGFVCSDIQTDLEESIAQIENVSDVRLKCRVEYCDSLQMQRIMLMNKDCELMRVA